MILAPPLKPMENLGTPIGPTSSIWKTYGCLWCLVFLLTRFWNTCVFALTVCKKAYYSATSRWPSKLPDLRRYFFDLRRYFCGAGPFAKGLWIAPARCHSRYRRRPSSPYVLEAQRVIRTRSQHGSESLWHSSCIETIPPFRGLNQIVSVAICKSKRKHVQPSAGYIEQLLFIEVCYITRRFFR